MSALHLETVAVIDGMIEFFIDPVVQSKYTLDISITRFIRTEFNRWKFSSAV